ncbi:MAG: M48 family metallopeptidase [bacterium]
MVNTIFWIIVGIILFDYFFEKLLDWLNYKNMSEQLPAQLENIYDKEKYRQSQQYEKVTTRFSFLTGTLSLVLILTILLLGGFGYLDRWVRGMTDNIYWQTLLFFGTLGIVFDILSLPFQLYSTFVIEERFGFNKTTYKTFVADKFKSWLLGAVIGGGLLMFVLWAWLSMGAWFWPIVFTGLGIFMIFMAMFYTHLIVPIFNKLTPLPEGELRDSLEAFGNQANFQIKDIYVIDGSKRSTRANAYFSGFGPRKRIVLYDTLLQDLSQEEIVAVLAHEIGHYKRRHVLKGMITSLIQSGLMLLLLYFSVGQPVLSLSIGAVEPSFYMGLLAFGLLFSPISFVTGIFSNIQSRKYEYEADAYTGKHGLGKFLIDALIKLSVKNLSNLTPHPAYVFFHYSHPTLLQRKQQIEAYRQAS